MNSNPGKGKGRKLRRFIWGGIAAVFVGFTFLFLKMNGHIPDLFSPSGPGYNNEVYQRMVDVRPSFGRVWHHSVGFGSGFHYYRVHLTASDFAASSVAALQPLPRPQFMNAPIWFSPPLPQEGGRWFTGPGMGASTESIYIYDERRQLLFARCEFD